MNTQVSNNNSVYDAQGVDRIWPTFSAEISKLDCPLDPVEVRKLYDRIKDDRGDDRDIRGPWHRSKRGRERGTFPSDVTNINSLAEDFGRYRLTPIRTHLDLEMDGLDGLKHPVRPAEIMCANLGLPTLPPHNTFCYYVRKAWVFKKLYKSGKNGIVMNPVMRAAALQWVEIF
jgi:hypothetical protein